MKDKEKINFLEETLACLRQHRKTEEEVLWVGRGFGGRQDRQEYRTTWADFQSKADFDYDAGYGLVCIPLDLILVGKDFWIMRREFHGSEWWEFETMPLVTPLMSKELDLSDTYKVLKFEESQEAKLKELRMREMEGSPEPDLEARVLEDLFRW